MENNITDEGHFDSGDDSEEDVISSYLPDDSIKNETVDEVLLMQQGSNNFIPKAASPETYSPTGIPTILLTTSSSKSSNMVLENNINRLHKIQDVVHRLREQNSQPLNEQESRKNLLKSQLSLSCPSLVDDEMSFDSSDSKLAANEEQQHMSVSNIERSATCGVTAEAVNANVKKLEDHGWLNSYNQPVQTVGREEFRIHINDMTPSSSQECLATRNNLLISTETQHSCSSINVVDVISNRQLQPQPQGLEPEIRAGVPSQSARRRRSWSSADQDEEKSKIKNALAKTQRSMSLSSLDSETDETFFDAHDYTGEELDMTVSVNSADGRRDKQRSFSGSSSPLHMPTTDIDYSSYHSLNDCSIKDHMAKGVIYLDGNFKHSVKNNLSTPRTSLQKSVSTPSIVNPKEVQDLSRGPVSHHIHVSVPHDNDQEQALSKRKKRTGSLFSKRKKGKDKESSKKSTHHFVSVCYSTSAVCHVCNKSMANKSALHCETCLVNVHEHSCKDQISDCSHFKAYSKGNNRFFPLNQGQNISNSRRPAMSSSHIGFPSISPPLTAKEKKAISTNQVKILNQGNSASGGKLIISSSSSGRVYIPSGYSQWRRVATKLGVNKVINEEKEVDAGEEISTNIVELNSTSLESLDEDVGLTSGNLDINEVEEDPELRLLEEEPASWSSTVEKKVLKKLKDKEVKKQESIYELILTEKHHCLTLKIMHKIYAQGMLRELQMPVDMVQKIFPCLEELLDFHMMFLKKLRERQKKKPVIDNIGDIILQQFQGKLAEQMQKAYGTFCGQHKDAVNVYKDILKSDRKFQSFIKRTSQFPLCKTRRIPECILLVTQRVTKYPLLIEALMKTTKDNKSEHQILSESNTLVKDIITKINADVAEKEKAFRLFEIYQRIDPKSATIFRSKKFKKSDVLSNSRQLRFEGPVRLSQARGKVLDVTAVILSDIIFFLQENNQKFSFVTQDNKAGVISLQKLLVREKAGQDSKGIYLISSNPHDPEMYELMCLSQKDKKMWMENIRAAVEICPVEDEGILDGNEEEKKVYDLKMAKLNELFTVLQRKDISLAEICEDKMSILTQMMDVVRKDDFTDNNAYKYVHLMTKNMDVPQTREILIGLQEASRLASTLYSGGTNLSRSVSSVGEHQSDAYVSPILPKRAETFGGFDNSNKDANNLQKANLKKKHHLLKDIDGRTNSLVNLNMEKDSGSSDGSDTLLHVKSIKEVRRASGPLPSRETNSETPEASNARRSTMANSLLTPDLMWSIENSSGYVGANELSMTDDKGTLEDLLTLSSTPPLITLGKEQWTAALQLTHYLNTLMCLFSKHLTDIESLRAQLALANEHLAKLRQEASRDSRDKRHLYRPNLQLEELRNLQDKLSQERSSWQQTYETQSRELAEKKEELLRMQEELKRRENDIFQQRDQVFRKLEQLQRLGIDLSFSSSGELLSSINLENLQEMLSTDVHRRSITYETQNQINDCMSGISASNPPSSSSSISPPQTVENNKKFPKSENSGSIKGRSNSITGSFSSVKRDNNLITPINLYSATNQQKTASQALPVRQQLPLKLARESTVSSSNLQHHSPHLQKQCESSSGSGSKAPVHQQGTHSRGSNTNNNNNNNNNNNSAIMMMMTTTTGPTVSTATASLGAATLASLPPQSGVPLPGTSHLKDSDSNQEIIYF